MNRYIITREKEQCTKINKLDTASFTVAIKFILLTSIFNAKGHHNVAIVNIPTAFVQTCLKNKKNKAIV
jgi:hypothetical protein